MRGLGGHQSDTMSPVKILNQIRSGMSSLCKEEPLGSVSFSVSVSAPGLSLCGSSLQHARLAAQTFTIYTAMQRGEAGRGSRGRGRGHAPTQLTDGQQHLRHICFTRGRRQSLFDILIAFAKTH